MQTEPSLGQMSFLAAGLAYSCHWLSLFLIELFHFCKLIPVPCSVFQVDSSSPGGPKSLRWDSFTTGPRGSIGGVISWDSRPERDQRIHHYKICISLWRPEQLRKITGKWLMYVRCRCTHSGVSREVLESTRVADREKQEKRRDGSVRKRCSHGSGFL